MQTSLVMTVVGKDRTGLVRSLAKLVADYGGNWLESRMCRLGGEFAGILRVMIPADKRAELEKAIFTLQDLTIIIRSDEPAAAPERQSLALLEVVGHDRPGIVREITDALAGQGVNVEELLTECTSAPMSGEPLFRAKATILLPDGVAVDTLRQSLERAAPDMTIEIAATKA